MIQIDDCLVSDDLLAREFACNLKACKGACCVEGAYGAPLEEAETHILERLKDDLHPFLRPEGRRAIAEQGPYVKGEDGEWETPLVEGAECAYALFDSDGTAKCGIEKAYLEGAVDFRKPVSCHLYPVRVKRYSRLTAVNYHSWEICDPACSLGHELGMPVYVFAKEALVRKFGTEWYARLEAAADGAGGSPPTQD